MADLQQAALAQAEALLLDSVSRSIRDGTTSAGLLTQAEVFEKASTSITQRFKSIAAVFRRDYNSQQPVNQLPPELLADIFEWCLDVSFSDGYRQDATQLHRICAVCSHWRHLAERSPNLWRYVSGLDPLPHVEKALKLSEPMSINVVYLHDSGFRLSESEFTAAVNPHVARWSRASMVYEDLEKNPQPWESAELPKLRTLDVASDSSEYTRAPIALSSGRELPNLQVIKLLDVPLRWDPGQLPGLRVFDLTGYDDSRMAPTTSQLLQLLMNTPRLENLTLYDVQILADGAVGLSATLPNLITLQLYGIPWDGMKQLLLSIQLPQCNRDSIHRNKTRDLLSEDHPGNSNNLAHSGSDLDIFGFHDWETSFNTRRFEVSASPTLGSDAIACMEALVQKFATALAASQGIQAKIGIPAGLESSAINPVLDTLDRLPSLSALWMIQSHASSKTEPFLTLVRLLSQPKDPVDGGVWYVPHLESISIRFQKPPNRELGELCRARREAARTSGYPKAIKELRIFHLNKYFQPESKRQLNQEMVEELDILQDALGEGQLFWGSELWKRSLDIQVPEPTWLSLD